MRRQKKKTQKRPGENDLVAECASSSKETLQKKPENVQVEREFEQSDEATAKKEKRRRSSVTSERGNEVEEAALSHRDVLLQVQPALTDDARESAAAACADLRAKTDDHSLSVTAHCLESLIRITTAHAKVRLSVEVDRRDYAVALQLVSFALYGGAQGDDTAEDAAVFNSIRWRLRLVETVLGEDDGGYSGEPRTVRVV